MHAEHNESVLRAEGADIRATDRNVDEPLSKSVEIGAHRKMPHGELGMQLEQALAIFTAVGVLARNAHDRHARFVRPRETRAKAGG